MGRQPELLDLFCGAGGASAGYRRAGFCVTGVDSAPQPNYPFEFIRGDALALDKAVLRRFDAIHASPPCQHYSVLAKRNGNAGDHPDLVAAVREMLERTGRPWVIENVPGAPLRNPVVLSGTMFPGLRVIRRRLFEASFPLPLPPLAPPPPLCHTLDKRKAHYGKTCEWTDFVMVNGGGNCSAAAARDAMGIDWMTKREINEAIPPAYTAWVGQALMRHLQGSRDGKKDRIESAHPPLPETAHG
ncbi:MAG: DNA cytosine methyltransferase [Rhodobacteraceae bacterium]|nr:DNA cytosine methyltransferase [Paracoccaceae bacterium]